jgi:hypothetical protein
MIRSAGSSSSTLRLLVTRRSITPVPPLAANIRAAIPAIPLSSMAITRLAPARAAKSERMPVPQPISTTVLPRACRSIADL